MSRIYLLLLGMIGTFASGLSGQAIVGADPAKGFVIDSNPKGATVYIENEVIGKTPCPFSFAISGRYRLWAYKKGYENWSQNFTFNEKSIQSIFFKLTPKTRSRALLRSLVLPGWGQGYSDRKMGGRLLLGLQLGSLASLAVADKQYRKHRDDYKSQYATYEGLSKSISQEPKAWQQLQHAYDQADDAHRMRNLVAGAALAVYLINLVDVLANFPRNFRQIEFIPTLSPGSSPSGPAGKISVNFSLPN